tara:strand:- start:64 stop:969 length:906 start_codon:yes stop_codon:yes gene_type:complete
LKIVISIFSLPYEIDELENTLNQLRRASYYLNNKFEWELDVTLGLSDTLVNWGNSRIPKEYFSDRFSNLAKTIDWCRGNFYISADDINGCVSQRRHSLNKHKDADYFLWLDTDIIFDERTLSYIESSILATKDITTYSIITPEIVRVWDNSWDCIVNEEFLDKPLDYQKTNDPYKDSGIKGDISINTVNNIHSPQSRFKFAGGWMTCLSGDLLRRIGVPDGLGHYGYEDTLIMVASENLERDINSNLNIQQFKIKNLVVCENYKYRDNSFYKSFLSVNDMRKTYLEYAESNAQMELDKILV